MKKYTIPVLEKFPIPVIKFETNEGRSIYALVDSGCSTSFVNEKFEELFPNFVLWSKECGKGNFVGFKTERELDCTRLLVALPRISDSGEPGQVKIIGFRDDLSLLTNNLMKPNGIDDDLHLVIGNDILTALGGRLNMKKKTLTLYVKKSRKKKTQKAA